MQSCIFLTLYRVEMVICEELWWLQFNCFNVTSKNRKINITQNLSQRLPAHWLLSLPSDPIMEDLCVDTFGIFSVFVFHIANFISSGVFQEEDAKVVVFGANLLGNIDLSLSPFKADAIWQSWEVCSDNR